MLLFEFANGLLLALFAAAVFDLAAVWRRTGSVRAAFGWLWRTEHPLFGDWLWPRRQMVAAPLFAAGLALYEANVVFCNSMARENWPWVQGALSPVLEWAAFLCFGAKILLCTRYSWRGLGLAGALYFIARWVHFNSHNIWFIGIVVAILAAKDVDLCRALRAFFAAGAAAMAVVLALHFAGIVAPDLVSERVGVFRPTFGYGHPNTFGGLVVGLLLAWVMLRARHLHWMDVAASAAVGVFLWEGPACRTAALSAFFLTLLLAAALVRPSVFRGRAVPWLAALSVAVVGAVSYLLPLGLVKCGPWNDDFGPAWLARIDGALTNRLSMTWMAYRLHTIKIAGQVLSDWPALDNSFAFMLYQFGPVMAALIAALFAAALWGLFRSGKTVWGCCLLAMLVYSFAECQSFHLTTNPTALLLCGAVFAMPLSRWGEAPSS